MDLFLNSLEITNKTSLSTISQAMVRIEKILDKDLEDIKIKDLKDSEAIVDTLTENYSLNSVITTIINLKKFITYKKGSAELVNEYNAYINDLVKERDLEKSKQNFNSQKEEDNYIEYNELKKLILDKSNEYFENKKSFTEYRNFLILGLYVLMPPARIQNWICMKRKTAIQMKRKGESLTKKYNYIIRLPNGKYDVIFNVYKTKKSIGQKRYSIENDLLNKLIENWTLNYANKKSDFFLTNANGRNMTQSNFTNALSSISKRVVDKELTNNSLRRIFITYFLKLNPSFIEKQEVLALMGQNATQTTAEKYVINEMNRGIYKLKFD